MAWVTEYDMTWRSPTAAGTIEIQRDGGSYKFPLKLQAGSLEIEHTIPSWDDPIARMNCSFTVVNDLSDFYDLLPLMTIEDGEYRVVVTNETVLPSQTLFTGYINCEAVDQAMLNYADLTITASGLLNKLQYDYPPSLDTLQYISLIDLIDEILRMTGSEYNIMVNCDLYEEDAGYTALTTLFNRTYIFTEVFWKNNVERNNGLEILTTILKTFNCYLYWREDVWYIDHYEDLYQTRYYVLYTTGVSYEHSDTGSDGETSIQTVSIWNNPYFKQVGGTQRIRVIPGMRQLDIRLDHKQYFNMFNPDIGLAATYVHTSQPVTLLQPRVWWGYEKPGSPFPLPMDWVANTAGKPFRTIANSIYRSGYDITTGNEELNGLSTRFFVTANGDTNLIIKWKFGVHNPGLFRINITSEDTITFHWSLCLYDPTEANRDYIVWVPDSSGGEEEETNGSWTLVNDGDPIADTNTHVITLADLDPEYLVYEGEFKIALGQVDGILDSSGDSQNLDLMFVMGTETCQVSGETDKPADGAYYGDFVAAIDESPDVNLLQGEITTQFLEKKEITLDLFDAGWNYRNALFRYVNAYQFAPTSIWTYGFSGDSYLWGQDSVAKILMASKFRIYRVARQVIEMDLHHPAGLAYFPLCYPFVDSKQSNKLFVSLSTILRPQENTTTIKLYEYDSAEEVNLI